MGWHDHRGHCPVAEQKDIFQAGPSYQDLVNPVKETEEKKYEIDIDNLPDFPILAINHSRRVYNDGSKTDNGVAKEDLKDHIWYNKTMRFGTALFINGVCVNYGYLGKERCDKIAEEIKGLQIKMNTITIPYS